MDKKRVCKQVFWIILGFIMTFLPVNVQAIKQAVLPQIIINLPSRTLELCQGDTLLKEYQIAIGKPSAPTPTGKFLIMEKEVNPCWYPPDKGTIVPSGPSNPLGYRWLGIAPMYGIHGTNAPWSIGTAVSNGCVRMQEEDVEDLFEQVTCDTPVKIEYERVKVRIDASGKASIGIYPDVYGRQKITLASVKQALVSAGLDGLVEDTFLKSLIQAVPDRQIEFAQTHKLKINGTMRIEHIISIAGDKQIPVMALADSLNTSVNWDENQQIVSRQNKMAPGKKRGNSVYISVEYLPTLFGGREVWNDQQNCLELMLPVAKFEGQILSGDIHQKKSGWVVPALPVAAVLGERIKWQPNKPELLIHGRAAPIIIVDGQPFITVNDMGQLFNMATHWDGQTQTLELSYPLYMVDYSMYLDPGEEFL